MAEKGKNTLNVLKISASEIEVVPHWFEEGPARFVARAATTVPRHR